MRILTLSTHGIQCGIADYNSHLMEAIRSLGHTCDVAAIDLAAVLDIQSTQPFEEFVQRLNGYDAIIVQHEFGIFGPRYDSSVNRLRQVLAEIRKTNKPAAVIFHTVFENLKFFRSLRKRTLRHWLSKRRLVLEFNTDARLRAFVHGSNAKAKLQQLGIDAARIFSAHHPVPRLEPAGKTGAPNQATTLAIFGFIFQYKGYETALAALKILGPGFRIVIAGGQHPEQKQDPTLESINGYLDTGKWSRNSVLTPSIKSDSADDARLRDRVEITGFLSEQQAVDVIDQADIVLAPYMLHGPDASGALTWAFALGKPMIASSTDTFRELALASGAIRLVAPNNPHELAGAIKELIDRPHVRTQLALSARRFAADHGYDYLAREILSHFADT